jgi:hypothetical protein
MLMILDGQGQAVYGQYGIPFPSRFVEKVEALVVER